MAPDIGMLLVKYVALWILVTGGIGAAIGRPKGLWVDGLVYGCLLGPLGWIIVLLKQPTEKAEARRQEEIDRVMTRRR